MKDLFEKLEKDCGQVFLSEEFNDEYYYEGNDLGAVYNKDETKFKTWSPVAVNINLCLYKKGTGDCLIEKIPMKKGDKGVWEVCVKRDLNGVFYTYEIEIDHLKEMDRDNSDNVRYAYCNSGKAYKNETQDVYSKAVGVNGNRSMVVDLSQTNPKGWENDTKPEFKSMTDAVIYELHVRDLSMDDESGITNKGKFLGIVENGTVNSNGSSTGLDHMKELGITHVHLLPSYDYETVDESKPEDNEFNWGYDPKNYNVPEGSYSTNPYDGSVRIKEFKEMVMKLHENGIRVIMDVVYNHTYTAYDSCFTCTFPNYYYRVKDNVNTNGSGCGNETASDHIMYRKYMIDSVLYWAKEYHVDGFRFDLMAVHDIDTMNQLAQAVKSYDPSIILYGEGWTGGPSLLEFEKASFKDNGTYIPEVAMFSDDIRDALKGSVMDADDKGFANGGLAQKTGDKLEQLVNSMKFGICGSTRHPQVKSKEDVDWEKAPVFWANTPLQCISYVSVHDNLTLWDKISLTCEDKSEKERIRINKLVAAVVLTSQGIPLFQAGEELLRSKPLDGGFDENSYKSPDSVNSIKWKNKDKYKDVFEYYKGLIEFRKAHKALRLTTDSDVATLIRFLETDNPGLIVYKIDSRQVNDTAKKIFVIINGTDKDEMVKLPEGKWSVNVNQNNAGTKELYGISNKIISEHMSVTILTC